MRLLLFVFIEIWLLPWQILAILVYTYKVKSKTNPEKISGTANEILSARLIMHRAGTREDEPSARLAPHLPAYGPAVAWLFGSFGLASRWSGYAISWAQYPVPRPSTMNAMVGHRTEFFDRLLSEAIDSKGQAPVKQVVILGAGWILAPGACWRAPTSASSRWTCRLPRLRSGRPWTRLACPRNGSPSSRPTSSRRLGSRHSRSGASIRRFQPSSCGRE